MRGPVKYRICKYRRRNKFFTRLQKVAIGSTPKQYRDSYYMKGWTDAEIETRLLLWLFSFKTASEARPTVRRKYRKTKGWLAPASRRRTWRYGLSRHPEYKKLTNVLVRMNSWGDLWPAAEKIYLLKKGLKEHEKNNHE